MSELFETFNSYKQNFLEYMEIWKFSCKNLSKNRLRVHFLGENFADFIYFKILQIFRMFRNFYRLCKSNLKTTCQTIVLKYGRRILIIELLSNIFLKVFTTIFFKTVWRRFKGKSMIFNMV